MEITVPSLFPAYTPLLFTSPKVTTGTDFSYSSIVSFLKVEANIYIHINMHI